MINPKIHRKTTTGLKIQPFNRYISRAIFLIICSQDFISWLQHHLIPCPFKFVTGIDCPGCGFQRSLLHLMQGDLKASIQLYPPAIPLISLGIFFLVKHYFIFKKSESIATILACLVGGIIIASYIQKMWQL
ncbi:DUF2752 domain-containing protein [Olivibacter domesticus]|uniref:DUF2752 domain-containing protein n=1 Tax=Olivibacter domesticus TaxID=407022 RepID=UPI000B818C58|nr:DUF2752 domain-containing protein [Olivibacter domesticus]